MVAFEFVLSFDFNYNNDNLLPYLTWGR